jgi:hypothetical protein
MSHDAPKAYSQLAINAWTIISASVTVLLAAIYTLGTPLMQAGHWIWDLLRWLASPII